METFLATMGQVLVRLIEMHGVDAHALMRELGIDPATLRDPDARISSDMADQLVARVAPAISDPGFALRAARCWHPSNLGVLGHAWLTSSTLRTALQRLERFNRLLGERARVKLTSGRDGLRVAFDPRRRDPKLHALGADLILSLVLDMCRVNYGASLRPVEVRLCRKRPANADPWKQFYGCPVRFDDRENSFLLASRVADEVLPIANRQLAGTLDAILEGQLAALDRDNIPARCKATLLDQMTSGEISEEGMAKALHMSRRTLQRKLAEADLSYLKLVDDTRHELALRYLDDSRKSVTEVTFLLGFSGQSAFSRAFRRWTGFSPTEYRAKKSGQAD